MSSESDPVFGKIRGQLKEVWDNFYRNGEERQGLKYTMARVLETPEIQNSPDGFELAEKLVLGDCPVAPEILQAALTHIAEKCKGDVTQPSKTYFPQLCTSFHGNYDLDKKACDLALGKQRLLEALNSEDPIGKVKELIPVMDLGWAGVKTQTGLFFTGKEAQEKLREAVQFFIDNPTDFISREKLDGYLEQIEQLGEITFGKNNKADPKKKNAMWLLRFFPDVSTVALMRHILGNPKANKSAVFPEFGDDPVKLARGDRGYVFRAFTKLPIWQKAVKWGEFDKEAFKAALTMINQFNAKTKERNAQLLGYRAAVEWMEGRSELTVPPSLPEMDADDADEEQPAGKLPVLSTDSRWKKLNQLRKKLAIQNCWTEEESVEYGLSERTIRSFGALKVQWQKILNKGRSRHDADEAISRELEMSLAEFQTDNRDNMGSASLFRALADPEYFCIWDEDFPVEQKYSSSDILGDAVRFFYYRERMDRFAEPIRLTPADPIKSRRASDLKALGAGKTYGHKEDFIYSARLAVRRDGLVQPTDILIQYSAPRLKRDGLLGRNGESIYAPPVLQAIMPDEKNKTDFKKSSVMLMPDMDSHGNLRILLNFPVSVDCFNNFSGTSFFGKEQFYFANSVQSRLLWPGYDRGKTPTWHVSGKGFDFVSVDLGQRFAAALTRINVSTETSPHGIRLGNDGKHDWFAKRTYAELLRLPGEDARILRNGERVCEEYGSRGRLADPEESQAALAFFEELGEDVQMLYPDGKNLIPYFPQQNDKMLIALRRGIGKLKQLDRWLWMLRNPENQEKVAVETKNAVWLPDQTPEGICDLEKTLREKLPRLMESLANRILPMSGRVWRWQSRKNDRQNVYWQLTAVSGDSCPKIRGQRGLSFARLTQLEELRKRCQTLNRIFMRKPGDPPQSIRDMRELVMPDCCPDILRRLDAMKEQRINQTANMILAQALGVRHKAHIASRAERLNAGVHGEYEPIPGVTPSAFIVMENLSRYKFSQDRSPYENTRLMKWAHRALVSKLKLLCEITGMIVVEVNAAYSSKFSAESIPGFRAEECRETELNSSYWTRKSLTPHGRQLLEAIRQNHWEMCRLDPHAQSLLPRDSGDIFVPFCGSDDLKQADINAAFNIGLRAVGDWRNFLIHNRIPMEYKKGRWQIRKSSKLAKVVYSDDIKISYEAEGSQKKGLNVFVIACPPSNLGFAENLLPKWENAGWRKFFLMPGSAVWRDMELQLERCCEINRARLERLRNQ